MISYICNSVLIKSHGNDKVNNHSIPYLQALEFVETKSQQAIILQKINKVY